MFKPLSLYLGLRYVRSRQGHGFSSFISASSTIGIALGVMVLIIVLSAMNGFEKALADKLLSIVPHAEMVSVNEPMSNWPARVDKVTQHPNVIAAAPVIKVTGMMQNGNQLKAVEFRGVDADEELNVSSINDFMIAGQWLSLKNKGDFNGEAQVLPHIVIGAGIAKKLNVVLGDKVQILLPQQSASKTLGSKFPAPKTYNMTIGGIFKFGGTVDDTMAFISIEKAGEVLSYQENFTQGIRLKVDNVFLAPHIVRAVAQDINHYVYMLDWTRTQGHLFNDIQLVRMVMFIVMVLVIAVASFNIVSTLIMVVNEKKGDIAILKTMGASPSIIMLTFVFQGMVNGLLGCVSGAAIGVFFAKNLTNVFTSIEQFFNIRFLTADVYFIDYLPSQLQMSDVYITVTTALVMSIVATLYPAWRATKIEPAQVLGQL